MEKKLFGTTTIFPKFCRGRPAPDDQYPSFSSCQFHMRTFRPISFDLFPSGIHTKCFIDLVVVYISLKDMSVEVAAEAVERVSNKYKLKLVQCLVMFQNLTCA